MLTERRIQIGVPVTQNDFSVSFFYIPFFIHRTKLTKLKSHFNLYQER